MRDNKCLFINLFIISILYSHFSGRFGKPYNLAICAAFGGLAKHQQIKELKAGAEVAVCTPGRMIDLIKAKACSLKRTTYVVSVNRNRTLELLICIYTFVLFKC